MLAKRIINERQVYSICEKSIEIIAARQKQCTRVLLALQGIKPFNRRLALVPVKPAGYFYNRGIIAYFLRRRAEARQRLQAD